MATTPTAPTKGVRLPALYVAAPPSDTSVIERWKLATTLTGAKSYGRLMVMALDALDRERAADGLTTSKAMMESPAHPLDRGARL